MNKNKFFSANTQIDNVKARILLTMKLILIARLGIFTPIPGIDHNAFSSSLAKNSIVSFLNVFTGGSFTSVGLFSLGIVPYINASIIVQLLTTAIPSLERLQKEEGELGKKKISQITRYISLGWSFIQALGIAFWLKPYIFEWNIYFVVQTILLLVSGSMLIMWFAETITEKGIGNGPSIIIFVNIVSNMSRVISEISTGKYNLGNFQNWLIYLAIVLVTIIGIILVQEGTRKIPIISARQLGKHNAQTQNSYLPLRLNQSGVMPIIFASAVLVLPASIIQITNNIYVARILSLFSPSSPTKIVYFLFYFFLILFFSYFYTSIILNPEELSQNLKKMTVTIPGIKPGAMTEKFLKKTLNKLTFLGAIFLACVAIIPIISEFLTGMAIFKGFGGTSILILVGVAIDTSRQLQTYLISKNYENVMK
uniref:Protein translocase subunit SecY n=1 Tax=Sciadococcus taiwanensis TaxID=3028030 RepID=A0A9Y1I2B6_9RHOD|nr:preprotein translocase subunit SecY [Sciadococcus taiwanensis]